MLRRVSHRIRVPPGAHLAAMLLAVASLATPIFAASGALAQVPAAGASADIRDASGRQVAQAQFREGRGEVLITIVFPAQPVLSGTHALHIQTTGRCDPPDYVTAGDDFNPTNKKHGRQNPDGPMVGDLPNVNFTTGLTSYNTSASGATLGAGGTSLLMPSRGLVFYSGQDDQLTDPDGNSGARIACGVIVAGPGAGAGASASAVQAPGTGGVAVQPVISPGVVVSPSAGVKPAAVASPVPSVASVASPIVVAGVTPTPIVILVTPLPVTALATQPGSGLGSGAALLIAVLGVVMIGAGYLLRQHRHLQ